MADVAVESSGRADRLSRYSTVFLARALPRNGQIDTLEISPLHAKIANQTFIDADLYPFPKVHVGPALDTLKTMKPPGAAEGLEPSGYDLVFIDADKVFWPPSLMLHLLIRNRRISLRTSRKPCD